MLTLWDLISPVMRMLRPKPPAPIARPARPARKRPARRKSLSNATVTATAPAAARPQVDATGQLFRRPPARTLQRGGAQAATAKPLPAEPPKPARRPQRAQDRYDQVVQTLCDEHGIRVKRWRNSMSGVAWCVKYKDGSIGRFVESPKPKSPMSAAIFLHEIGHHAIGFDRFKPRCLEEYHAWRWSMEAMERHGLQVTEQVKHRMALSLWYAVDKARRRGLRKLPVELSPYLTRPAKRVPAKTALAAKA